MTRVTLANGSEIVVSATVAEIMDSIATASPSPWIDLTLVSSQVFRINSFIIAYMCTEE